MPRTLKRRSDAISRNSPSASASDSEPGPSTTARSQQRRPPTPSPAPNSDVEGNLSDASDTSTPSSAVQQTTLAKRLVRLALSCEAARIPLRRTEIQSRIFKDAGGRVKFKAVFELAQQQLRHVFGMELVDLPGRQLSSLTERRKATQAETQTQTQRRKRNDDGATQSGTQRKGGDPVSSAQSWMLVSCLPEAYRHHPAVIPPSRAPTAEEEATYTALYSLIISLIYLNSPPATLTPSTSLSAGNEEILPLPDSKLYRYLTRLGLDSWTPTPILAGGSSLDKLMARMVKEGYLEKKRDTSSGEEMVEWSVGPRGRREIGRDGVAGLVMSVYGHGVGSVTARQTDEQDEDENEDDHAAPRRNGVDRDELARRLKRTLGNISLPDPDLGQQDAEPVAEESTEAQPAEDTPGTSLGRSSRRDRNHEHATDDE